jgi:zinc finger protein
MSIPEIDLELQQGTLGGRFTTVEGILQQVSHACPVMAMI